jgi:hypothetical protein
MYQPSKTITEQMNEEERVREALLYLLRDIEKLERLQKDHLSEVNAQKRRLT